MNVVLQKIRMNNFFLNQGENKEIFIKNNSSFKFLLKKNSSLYVKNVIFEANNNNVINILGNFESKSIFKYVVVDFSQNDISLNINLNLDKPDLQVYIYIFCLSFKNNKKTFNVYLNNKNKNIETSIDAFGFAFDQSNINFLNTCIAQKKAKKNVICQKGKIIIFDKKAVGFIRPVLKIFENDVSALHNASIGYFNNDYFFYLLSRGLKKNDIKKMLINGFLKKIFSFFDKDVSEDINKTVKKYVQC